MSNWLVQLFRYICCNSIHKTMKMNISGVCCTSFILWAFLCRKYAYFRPTKCDLVNDHMVHQLLLTEVFIIWLQNTFWCIDCICPKEHATFKVIVLLLLFSQLYEKSSLKNRSRMHNMWCSGTRIFVDLVCRDARIPLGLLLFLTLESNHFYSVFLRTPC